MRDDETASSSLSLQEIHPTLAKSSCFISQVPKLLNSVLAANFEEFLLNSATIL
jgi:hypothetical protein